MFNFQELKVLLDASNEGVIYWSFGSMSRIETIPSAKLAQILEVLSELPQSVLVKMDRAMLARNLTVPDNVYTMDWIPQYATLCKCQLAIIFSQKTVISMKLWKFPAAAYYLFIYIYCELLIASSLDIGMFKTFV